MSVMVFMEDWLLTRSGVTTVIPALLKSFRNPRVTEAARGPVSCRLRRCGKMLLS